MLVAYAQCLERYTCQFHIITFVRYDEVWRHLWRPHEKGVWECWNYEMFVDSIAFKEYICCLYLRMEGVGGGGGSQNWPFFVDVINVWPIRVWQLKIKTMCHLRNVEVTTRRVLEMWYLDSWSWSRTEISLIRNFITLTVLR